MFGRIFSETTPKDKFLAYFAWEIGLQNFSWAVFLLYFHQGSLNKIYQIFPNQSIQIFVILINLNLIFK